MIMSGCGFKYDVNIIYNKANSPLSKTADTETSLRFTEYLNERCSGWGIKRTFYYDRDALPGKNIFTQLQETVDSSRYTVVILTPGFVRDCWAGYKQQWAFKKLLDKNQSHRLLPIAVGLSEEQIPSNLDIQNVVHFQSDWNKDDEESQWMKVKNALQEDQAAVERTIHTEEAGDNLTRSSKGHLVIQESEPHKRVLDRCYDRIVEDLFADQVLRLLIPKRLFEYVTIKNIQEEQKSSEKNRQLVDLIRSSGQLAYDSFKTCLEESKQQGLVKILEEEESNCGLRAGSVDSTTVESITPSESCLDSPDFGGEDFKPSTHTQGNSKPPDVLYQRTDTAVTSQTIQSVIPDMQGAVNAVAEATSESTHTTNMTRQLSSKEAVLSLETDTSPSADYASITLESGPKLSAPVMKPPNTEVKSLAQSKEVNSVQKSESGKLAASSESPHSVLPFRSDHPVELEPINQSSVSPLLSQMSLSQDEDLTMDHTSLLPEDTEIKGNSNADNANNNAELLKTEQSKQKPVPSTSDMVDNKPTSHASNDMISPSCATVPLSPLQAQISLSQDNDLVFDESTEPDTTKHLGIGNDSQEQNDMASMMREEPDGHEIETNKVRKSHDNGQTTQPKSAAMDEQRSVDSGCRGERENAQSGQAEVTGNSVVNETTPVSSEGQSSLSWCVRSLISFYWQPELAFSVLQK